MRLTLQPFMMDMWYGGDPRQVFDHFRLADRKGFDGVMLPEHILFSPEEIKDYPYGKTASYQDEQVEEEQMFDEFTPFFETISHLSAIAAITEHMTLSTAIMLAPLRPATLLAKQLATLDHLSGGRVQIGYGTGWVEIDYTAQGLDFKKRRGHMVEVAEACREIWTSAPATYHGEHINFDDVYALPFPVQKGGIPQLFGLGTSDRNVERIARVADGWCPLLVSPEEVKETLAKIKARMAELDRDSSDFIVRLHANPIERDGRANFDATVAAIPEMLEAGATDISIATMDFCASPDEFEDFVDACMAEKKKYA